MNYYQLDGEILSSVQSLDETQKTNVLEYISRMDRRPYSTKRYRSRAMRQIREALQNA